jgi:hypothetical protein
MRREAIRAFEIAMILQGEFMMRELSSNQTVMINVFTNTINIYWRSSNECDNKNRSCGQ